MKAIRFYGQGDLRLEEVSMPTVDAGGFLVKVEACAICGTDLKMHRRGDPRVKIGQIIGHEFVGRIVEIGDGVNGFAAGERVTMATSISCGDCDVCKAGYTNRCEHLTPISRTYPGAFAEYIAIPRCGVERGFVVKVPETVGDIAALAEPMSCAINAQELAGVKDGDTVIVIGCGPLGALHTQIARANGAAKVVVTQRSADRLERAKKLGVDAIIDCNAVDPIKAVMDLTNGQGADVVIATAPNISAQQQAFSMAKKGGRVNLFAGLPTGESILKIDSRLIHYRELLISGASDSTPRHVKQALDMLAGGDIAECVISHRIGIDDFAKGITLMEQSIGFKILILPED